MNKKVKTYSLLILIGILLAYITSQLLKLIFGNFNTFDKEKDYTFFILSVLIAPFIETFIFQYIVFKIPFSLNILKINKYSITFLILISTILFTFQHQYNIAYTIYAGVIGLYLAITFAYAEYIKEGLISGFKLVASIHLLLNFIAEISKLLSL
nr:CPBP family glutamic-type intramembrane protease [uncultured Bacteroides sp.]